MSLISYTGNMLVADRIGLATKNTSRHEDMQKIFVQRDKLFAVAYCGDRLPDRYVDEMMDLFLMYLIKHIAADRRMPIIPGVNNRAFLFAGRQFIIMTHNQVFFRSTDSPHGEWVEIATDRQISAGSFEPAFVVARAFGLTPVEALKETVRFLMGRANPVVDSFPRNKLSKKLDKVAKAFEEIQKKKIKEVGLTDEMGMGERLA